MFPFDLTECEVIETPFKSNGTNWVNVCIRFDNQEINYEFRLQNDTDKTPIDD